jgi:hypothetical protein
MNHAAVIPSSGVACQPTSANFGQLSVSYCGETQAYSAIAVIQILHCVDTAFHSAPTLKKTHRRNLTQDITDAKTVNKMAKYSVKKWFNRDFPERLQTHAYTE